jgi:hypothetical protein
VRQLDEDPGSVAGLGVGARGAAVLEVRERAQGPADGLVRGAGIQPGDEGHPAGVVLVRRVVETWKNSALCRASRRGWGAG